MTDAVVAGLASAGGSLGVALPGLLVLWLLRRRRLTVLVPLTVVIGALSLSAGLVTSSRQMGSDVSQAHVLAPALTVAGLVSLAGGLLVARWIAESGRALGVVLATGDGTVDGPAELRRLGRDLALSRTREVALEASRRELVSWVSHDLRTPLAGLRAMTEALEDGVVADPPTVARYHATMRGEVERLASLVDDLFELSRLQAGVLPPSVDLAMLSDLISDALASADPLARDRHVRLAGPKPGSLPELQVGAADVGRVLRNLLVNAIRHTPYDGTVAVHAEVADGAVAVAVQDSCGGIPDSDLPRVFEPAFRGTAARSPGAAAGGGLGLAIARGLVHRHDGDISVANAGAGCRFTVRFPLPS